MNVKLVATPTDDSPVVSRAPWLTPRRLIGFLLGWLALFAIVSVFVSNPFQSEANAASGPNYAHVMFLHGLLIGMVGLMALLTLQVFSIRAQHIRLLIAGGAVAATVLASIGGIWDKTIPGSEVPMWTQILGFFALDEILLLLIVSLLLEWRRGSAVTRSVTFIAGALAAFAMAVAAVMGHLAGWLMEFGYMPGVLGNFARWLGFGKIDDFTGALVGSHSHEMAVGAMALVAVLLAQQFGYATLTGVPRIVSRIGLGMVAVGTVIMTGLYVAMAFTIWSVPTLFESSNGGIAGDDIVTGILVMGGGLVLGTAFIASLGRPVSRLAAVWAWLISFATVVVAGYAIELNTNYFGAGDPSASGAANDAVFTWMHQDIGLFLLPTLVIVMLVVERLVSSFRVLPALIGIVAMVGSTILFCGAMVWSFIDPALYGPGYILSTTGLVAVGAAILATLYWGVIKQRPAQSVEPAVTPINPLQLPVVAKPVSTARQEVSHQ